LLSSAHRFAALKRVDLHLTTDGKKNLKEKRAPE